LRCNYFIEESKMESITAIGGTHRISWGAIIAGVVIALAFEALLNLLGLGFGFNAFTVDANVITNIGIGSIVWLVISGVLSMFVGGWVAGRMTDLDLPLDGALHGLVAWGLATLLTFSFIATTAGALVSGMANIVGQGINLAGQSAAMIGQGAVQVAPQLAQAAQNLVPDLKPAINQIQQQADQILAQTSQAGNQAADNASANMPQSPQQAKIQLHKAVIAFLNAVNQDDTAAAQQQLVNFLVDNAGMSVDQAQQTVSDWQQQYYQMKQQISQKAEQAKQQAIASTEQATDVMGTITLLSFAVFLLSAIAGAVGGMLGARRNRNYAVHNTHTRTKF
jgi:hypothetical protein